MHPYDAYQSARRAALRQVLKRRFGEFGPGSSFDPTTSSVAGYEHFFIGRDVFIGRYAMMSADGVRVDIQDGTIIGPGFFLMTGDHRHDVPGVGYRDHGEGVNMPIWIGRDVWIGSRVTVLKGVHIGDSCIIGAGAVVTRDVPAFSVAMGVPARVVGERFTGERRTLHERFLAG